MLKSALKPAVEWLASSLFLLPRPMQQPRLWVLMYHRILPSEDARALTEEPGMIVTPETFAMHLQVLREHFEFVALDSWLTARARGESLPARACVITFDDGWRDNYEFAWPLLRQHQVPATIFLVSDMIGTARSFWPNRLARLLQNAGTNWYADAALQWLSSQLPADLPKTSFREMLARCIAYCKTLPEELLLARLVQAEQLSTFPPAAEADLMDWQQIDEMANSGLIRFGSHTRNHMRLLPDAEESRLLDEVIGSKQRLEQHLQKPVELFCYPNGDVSPVAEHAVSQNYLGAVTTARGINDLHTPAPHLLRVGLHEDISDTPRKLLARLSCWL